MLVVVGCVAIGSRLQSVGGQPPDGLGDAPDASWSRELHGLARALWCCGTHSVGAAGRHTLLHGALHGAPPSPPQFIHLHNLEATHRQTLLCYHQHHTFAAEMSTEDQPCRGQGLLSIKTTINCSPCSYELTAPLFNKQPQRQTLNQAACPEIVTTVLTQARISRTASSQLVPQRNDRPAAAPTSVRPPCSEQYRYEKQMSSRNQLYV